MAEGKKSFIAYSDWYGTFKALPDEIAGQLIKYIFSYVNDENPKPHENFVVNALFEQVKATLKRDLNKWEKQREQRSEAGKKSAELRKGTKSNDRSNSLNEKTRKATVSVNDNVNVNVNVNDNVSEIKDKSFTINNKSFILQGLKDKQWLEVLAMQNRNSLDMVKNKLTTFEGFLISTKKQHNNYKEFASHFTYWLAKNKQEINSKSFSL